MDIGYKLSKLIEDLEISKGDFAKRIKISQSSLSHYLKGIRRIPLSVLQNIVTEFKLDPNYFFDDNDYKEYDPDAQKIIDKIKGNKSLKILFDKTGDLSDDEIEKIVKIIDITIPKEDDWC